MARRNRDDDLLLEEDELTAAFLGDEAGATLERGGQAALRAEAGGDGDVGE